MRVDIRLADGPVIRLEPEPVEVLDQRPIERRPAALAIVILDPEQDSGASSAGDAPGPDRVGDVTQMQVAGRGRRESGPGRDQEVDPSPPSPAR